MDCDVNTLGVDRMALRPLNAELGERIPRVRKAPLLIGSSGSAWPDISARCEMACTGGSAAAPDLSSDEQVVAPITIPGDLAVPPTAVRGFADLLVGDEDERTLCAVSAAPML
ncbi:hypothetical protein OG948_34495 (plasmid) [Embleya sp. NBC_00888]|uniref:hypothetical protein n=1 Tax=Embleya sp. NBC_00888 TaxID=2975960 RepID=UPI002F912F3F|nr:hypothetical protein OG948_34495 [Embleya sp. NBC_00888]